MLTLMLAMIDAPEEKQLFQAIYELHRNWMLKAAYEILRDRGLAEDAVSEAFFRVARKFSNLEIRDAEAVETKGLLMIIVKNEARRIYAKEKNRHQHEAFVEEPGWITDDTILTDIRVRMVLEEIQKMGSTFRDVLYLGLVEGLTARDIASELGISVSAVEKRMARGKKELKDRLVIWGEGEKNEE